jgi:hypothetical protein
MKRQWPDLTYYTGIRPKELRKTMRNLGQDNRSSDRDFNPGPPNYEAGMIPARPQHSVIYISEILLCHVVNGAIFGS